MAQSATTAKKCCLKTEQELANIAGGLYDVIEMQGKTFGMAEAIQATTSGGLSEIVNVSKAKPGDPSCTDVEVTIKYQVPQCGETADDDIDFDCDSQASESYTYQYENFTVDQFAAEKFTVAESDFDCDCMTPSVELAKVIARHVRSLYEKYNRKLSEQVATKFGSPWEVATSTATAPLPLKLFVENDFGQAVPQPMGIYDLIYQYQRMAPNIGLNPVLVSGSRKLGAYEMGGTLFQGNTDGQDASRMAMPNVYMDWQLPDVLSGGAASDPIVSWLPGAVNMASYNRFESETRRILPDGRVVWAPIQASRELVRQTVDVGTAVLGVPFVVDLQIFYDQCANTVTYTMRKDFGIFVIPQDAFCGTDAHNYILLWDVLCAPYNCANL